MNRQSSIAVFDSGIGGLYLSVFLQKAFKNESILFFQDSLNYPYGSKKKPENTFNLDKVLNFLIQQDVKVIIIACNTVYGLHHESYKGIPVIDVTDSAIWQIAQVSTHKRVLTLSTRTICENRVFDSIFERNHLTTTYVDCQILIDKIETDEEATYDMILKSILPKSNKLPFDTLFLGATHLTLVKEKIASYIPKTVLIDGVEVLIDHLKWFLMKYGMENEQDNEGQFQMYYSGDEHQSIAHLNRLNIPLVECKKAY